MLSWRLSPAEAVHHDASRLAVVYGSWRLSIAVPSRNDSFVAISAIKETANQNGYLSSLFSLSELRDLPFHLQEHVLDLPQIGPRKLRANRGWRLISFNVFRPSVNPVIESRRPNRSKKIDYCRGSLVSGEAGAWRA